jgi:hypothetical protein
LSRFFQNAATGTATDAEARQVLEAVDAVKRVLTATHRGRRLSKL